MTAAPFNYIRSHARPIGLILGPVLAILFYFTVELDPANPRAGRMAAIALLMSVWWVTEAAPLAATSLLPLV